MRQDLEGARKDADVVGIDAERERTAA